jgi:glucose-1-phosphate cytidylyltransferase
MKITNCVILAGGFGTRMAEYTKTIPKPMVEIGGKPILCHIINYYESYGVKKFTVALGYKSSYIKDYFKKKNHLYGHLNIKLVNTGLKTLTGGRIKRLEKYLDDNFFLTYGDGVSNVNLKKLESFHFENKKHLTMTIVHPPARFGEVKVKNNLIDRFDEKPQLQEGWINGGFFVMNRKVLSYIKDDYEMLEREPIQRILKKKQAAAYQHNKFWFCIDTKRDRDLLQKMWVKKERPWVNEARRK